MSSGQFPISTTIACGLAPSYCQRFDGAVVYARKLVASVTYRAAWEPTGDERWKRDPHGTGWILHDVHEITAVRRDPLTWTISQLSDQPSVALLKQIAATHLPGNARLLREEIVPAVLRLPMRPIDGADLPTKSCRCDPVFPGRGVSVCFIDGVEVGLKVSRTWDGAGAVSYFAEATIGWKHVSFEGRPRAFIYPSDARRVASFPSINALIQFVGRVLVLLVDFADRRTDIGLEVDPFRSYQLTAVATVKVVDEVDEVAFDVRLPTPSGQIEFVAFPWPGWYALAPAPGVPAVIHQPPPSTP